MSAVPATTLATALFSPRRIALIGASADPGKWTSRPIRYLRRHGFSGEIIPINPGRETIGDLPCYPSLGKAPAGIDQAFVMCRADEVDGVVDQCASLGVPCATILAGGFAESGPTGVDRQRRLVERARSGGVRLLGPNSMGMINTAGTVLSPNAALELETLPRGRLGVVSQSGSVIGALLSHGDARRIGFSKLVSVGNEADLDVGEVGSLLVEDAETDAVILFLESIRSFESYEKLAWKAERAGKPLIAFKLGRSAVGRDLASTHTGALVGDDNVADAVFAHLGIARVRMFESLLEAPPLFVGRARPKGRRVAVVTTTGGGGAMVVDCLGALDIELAAPPAETRAVLEEERVPQSGALVDLTLAGTRPTVVARVIDSLLASPDNDAVVMVVGSSGQFNPELAVEPLLRFAGSEKPLATYFVSNAELSRERLTRAGLAAFRTPESCADALKAYLDWTHPRAQAQPDLGPTQDHHPVQVFGPTHQDARRVLMRSGPVGEADAQLVLAAMGIDLPRQRLVRTPEEAVAAVDELGLPLVAKVQSADIPHKSDVGGVALDLRSVEDVLAARRTILASVGRSRPGASIDGILLQRQETGLGEVLVGLRRDEAGTVVVVVGAGGVLAEVHQDVALAVAPLDEARAYALIARVKALASLRGFRGRPRGDLDALARAVAAVSRLAGDPCVIEAEINPLLVRPEGEGVCALDALLVLAPMPHVAPH